jgi:hypothetical protein
MLSRERSPTGACLQPPAGCSGGRRRFSGCICGRSSPVVRVPGTRSEKREDTQRSLRPQPNELQLRHGVPWQFRFEFFALTIASRGQPSAPSKARPLFNSPGRKAGDRLATCADRRSIPGLPAWAINLSRHPCWRWLKRKTPSVICREATLHLSCGPENLGSKTRNRGISMKTPNED